VQAEIRAIHDSLQRNDRNITHSARQLGVSRMTLYRLMQKHGISL
jgi:transcriptional regulator of acetoin/glycerol metabolism